MKILAEALSEANEEFKSFKTKASSQEIREYMEVQKTLEHNLMKLREELI